MEVGEAPHSNLYHGHLVNPKAIEAEFQSVGADVNWSSVVVVGKGRRKPPSSRSVRS